MNSYMYLALFSHFDCLADANELRKVNNTLRQKDFLRFISLKLGASARFLRTAGIHVQYVGGAHT